MFTVTVVTEVRSQKLLVFGHRRMIKNIKQTAVINILKLSFYNLDVSYASQQSYLLGLQRFLDWENKAKTSRPENGTFQGPFKTRSLFCNC